MKSLKIKIYKFAKIFGFFKLAEMWTKKDLRILCYHGLSVFDEMSTHSDIFMTKEKFEKRMKIIRARKVNVMPLTTALDKLSKGEIRDVSTVVTFDDGFRDNYTIALPILEKYKIPATLYVATYYVDHQGPVFRLMLQWMMRRTLKTSVIFPGIDKSFPLTTPEERHSAFEVAKVWGEKELNHEQRTDFLARLAPLLDAPYTEALEHKMFHFLSNDELKSMSDRGVDIELHTHRHAVCNEKIDLKKEIRDNQESLLRHIGRTPTHFCYPSGVWSPAIADQLAALNISSATTCDLGLNTKETSRYKLNRFLDSEHCSEIEFEAELSGFAEILRRIFNTERSGQDYSA